MSHKLVAQIGEEGLIKEQHGVSYLTEWHQSSSNQTGGMRAEQKPAGEVSRTMQVGGVSGLARAELGIMNVVWELGISIYTDDWMPGFDDGLNVNYKRKRRIKTNSKGCIPNNCRGRFVIYNVGKYCGEIRVRFGICPSKCRLGV